jgi:hypothetical protein
LLLRWSAYIINLSVSNSDTNNQPATSIRLKRLGERFMTSIGGSDADARLCERLKAMGYADRNRIRIYGEEFDLLSNPISDQHGVSIEAKSRKTGNARRLRIPLSIVYMVRKDLKSANRSSSAA